MRNARRPEWPTGVSCGAGSAVTVGAALRHRRVDLHQELDVARGLLELVEDELEALLALETRQHATQLPHDGELVLAHEQLLAARARGVDVDRREDALVGEVTTQA